ncbi:nuclear transport factor 2 family protein [Novosphingobium barchaimii]|nr:nuclear transport factor 2 family protein [Novosphingobium barchaimii]
MTSDGQVVDRFFEGLSSGDLDAVLACLTPDARIWHCFDGVAQDRSEARQAWQSLIDNFPIRIFVDVRRERTSSGFVQQHMMMGTTKDGVNAAWAICAMIRIEGQLISRIDEYIDRAGKFDLAVNGEARTPGL